jgi:hypothetical protein
MSEPKTRFKVGDILIGTEYNSYGVTNQYNEVKVISISDEKYGGMTVSLVDIHNAKDSYGQRLYGTNHPFSKSITGSNLYQVSESLFKYSERRLKLEAIQEVLDG